MRAPFSVMELHRTMTALAIGLALATCFSIFTLMNRRHLLSTALAAPLAAPFAPALHAAEAPELTAEQVLVLVRRSYALQNHRMAGRLRDDDSGKEEPLELTLTGNVMRFRFKNAPPEIVHLDLTTTPATLWQVKSGGSTPIPLSNAADSVRGMDFNYEDLSLRFTYWKNVKMMDANARLTAARVKCWLIRVTAPDQKGPYYTVDLWVEKESGGVAKMEAYDTRSKMIKRFQVTKIQKVDGATVLKEMRIESFNPLNGSQKGRTYLTLDKPEKQ